MTMVLAHENGWASDDEVKDGQRGGMHSCLVYNK